MVQSRERANRPAQAAIVIMAGTLFSSGFGFARAFVIAHLFGAGPHTDAYFAALAIPQSIYDQFIGVAIAAVFIPTFARLAPAGPAQLWRVVTMTAVYVVAVAAVVIVVLEVAAAPVMQIIASGLSRRASTLSLSVTLLRVMLPALLFMSLSAIGAAALYSLHRRMIAAFGTALIHVGVIAAALLVGSRWGVLALAVGFAAGGALQLAVQLPLLLRLRGTPWKGIGPPDLSAPILRRMLRLYLPIVAGSAIALVGVIVDIDFKSHLPQPGGLSDMQYATQIVQFPIGVVVAALSLAVLPSLSADAGSGRMDDFKATLGQGLRLVMVLTIPAVVALLTLATPIVALLFQRGHFTHVATAHTVTALIGYAPQIPFVGVDQLLVVAFYARHNTVAPTWVASVGVGVYVAGAALLLGPLTIFGLALANTIQLAIQALILFVLLTQSLGPLDGRRLASTALKVLASAAPMAAVIVAVEMWLVGGLGVSVRAVTVGLPALIALGIYAAFLLLFRVEEAGLIWRAVTGRTRSNALP